ncbi:hypothetical protein K438DRAFT_1766002 [Mycena galopus ATCC 62051]|nr:hypothetical protein K438DRAFT_1766002 [Mycena galopus ATCC 62051]
MNLQPVHNPYNNMMYPPFLRQNQMQWQPHVHQNAAALISSQFAPSTGANPQHPGFAVVPQLTPVAPPRISAPRTEQNLVKGEPIHHDHSASSGQEWPTGLVRIERVKGQEDRKWKQNKWVWHSNGIVQHESNRVEVRQCIGVFRCDGCGRLVRPKTNAASRKAQLSGGCKSRTCTLGAPLVHDGCEARSFHFSYERDGETILVWEHRGYHSTHQRPPGGSISKAEEDQVDLQVLRKQEATAHELRTADTGPGSVPFPDISPALANPNAARYALGQSHLRLGITSTTFKGGIAFMNWFSELAKRLPTPWIVDSNLGTPVYISMQTPFMDDIIRECVESWILDLADGPSASRHGIAVDGDHAFFRGGQLLASCCYSMTSNEWIPIFYSWIDGQDISHHRPHFAWIFKAIIKHAGSRFTRKLLLFQVMDFSQAQRGAHAEEYADAVISTMSGFSSLSPEAQATERRQLVREAEEAEVGCDMHFWRSGDRIMKTHSLVPPTSIHIFGNALRELLSPNTSLERFDAVVSMIKTTFPATRSWMSWWERRTIASMIFPAKRAMSAELAAKVPSNSNPIEHQHSLLHHAVGKDHDLQPGFEKIYLHVREMEKKHEAIKGHFDASDIRNRRPEKPRTWHENDGRAPDTLAALAALDRESMDAPHSVPTLPVTAPNQQTAYSSHMLQSYPWSAPNSCFFDTGLELWFRVWTRWSSQERIAFLSSLPPSSALATFFYHFDRRLKWINERGTSIDGDRILGLGQSLARHAIFNKWKLYKNKGDYGCATTCLHHAIRDSNTSDMVQLQFGVGHLLSGRCPAQHLSRTGVGSIQTLLPINRFDLRTARAKQGPSTSLTEYFALCTPRISGGNDDSGTTVVHSLLPPPCSHPDCPPSTPVLIDEIGTLWPKILHINRETGTETRLEIAPGGVIDYELVGTTSFDPPRKHWTSKVLIDETTFHYDDLVYGGSLIAQGPADLILIPDQRASLWIYHRTSKFNESTKSLRNVASMYDAAFAVDLSRARSPPLTVHGSPLPNPPSTLSTTDNSGPNPNDDAAATKGSALTPFAINDQPPESAALYPEKPPPSEWCSGCRQICNESSVQHPAIQCHECRFWHHVKCIMDKSPYIEVNLNNWLCNICDGIPLDETPTWSNELIGTHILFQTLRQSSFYPGLIASLTSAGDVRVEWYPDNVYERGEKPLSSGFIITKEACASIASDNVDLIEELGRIRWPYRLAEDARELYLYENVEVSNALLLSREAVLDIITGSGPQLHPIVVDYENWMAEAGELKQSKHAADYILRFGSVNILPGDDSLMEPHAEYVLQAISPDDNSSETQRLRITTLVPLLLQFIILRLYLRRSSSDDEEIYFLARHFDKDELKIISADDPLSWEKRGRLTRHLTLPETILHIAEGNSAAEYVPRRFCKIGTILSKAAEARIPRNFVLASAYNSDGSDPSSSPDGMNVDLRKADNPESMGPILESEKVVKPSGKLKRKREVGVPGGENAGLRRSTRRRKEP